MKSMRLSELAQGRDNNFNLIRILAALAVLLQHATPTATGAMVKLGRSSLGMSFASIAVDVFFVTSGFLVTGSLVRGRGVRSYLYSRAARIFPALFVVVLLAVFGIGLVFTTLPLANYLSDSKTLEYLIRGCTAFFGVSFQLPGVFAANPYKDSVNASLWTLPHELHMYAILAALWWLCSRTRAGQAHQAFRNWIVAAAVLGMILLISYNFTSSAPRENGFRMLFFMFFSGAAYYVLRDRVVLSYPVFCSALAILVLSSLNRSLFFIAYIATLPYLLLFIAYVPSYAIRQYNRVGDYSYGVYIYAFPVEQVLAALIPGISTFLMIVLAIPATLLLAVVSWHLIERPALDLRRRHNSVPLRFSHDQTAGLGTALERAGQ
jgi:peptidoglycan/LPS O-acetylase OafA/YrhL